MEHAGLEDWRGACAHYNSRYAYACFSSILSARRPRAGPDATSFVDARLCADGGGLGAGLAGKYAGADERDDRAGSAGLAAELRARLGDGGVCDAAAVHGDAHAARERT